MHKGHLAGCAIGFLVALALVAITGGSAGSAGFLVATLLCPIAMVIAMRFLMGGSGHHTGRDEASRPPADRRVAQEGATRD